MLIDNSAIQRRVIQAVCDLAGGDVRGLRVLDLACAHGSYAVELATRGADALGIEGRAAWLEHARRLAEAHSASSARFVQDDVRNLSLERYGEFDIVLCLGILYHLDAPDVLALVDRVASVCRRFAVFETHFAESPEVAHERGGRRYWGRRVVEHEPGTPPEKKLAAMGASLDNEHSFWMTQASLCNLLRHAGFSSVMDCRVPMADLLVGEEREVRIWGNRITLVAIKGRPQSLVTVRETIEEHRLDWPESIEERRFERYIAEIGWSGQIAGREE